MDPLQRPARKLLRQCLALQPANRVTIVAHESQAETANAIWQVAKKTAVNSVLVSYRARRARDFTMPPGVTNCLTCSDIAVVLTPVFLEECLFDPARQHGARVAILQYSTPRQFIRALANDLVAVSNKSQKLADILSIGKCMQLASPSGTNTRVDITKTRGIAHAALARNPGEITSLPAGEASILMDGNIEGRVILDRLAGGKKKLAQPATLKLDAGEVAQIRGQGEIEILRKEIRKFGRPGRKIYELGIGTNDKVTFGKSAQEDEKVSGAVHLSFGQGPGGRGASDRPRIKGIVTQPTVSIDGRVIVDQGEIVI